MQFIGLKALQGLRFVSMYSDTVYRTVVTEYRYRVILNVFIHFFYSSQVDLMGYVMFCRWIYLITYSRTFPFLRRFIGGIWNIYSHRQRLCEEICMNRIILHSSDGPKQLSLV
jgi:hypothetical protein